MQQNISEAQNMTPSEFYDAVRNAGKWDYKQQGSQYEEFGNYNFGATAAATGFLPGNIPNRGAGWAQQQAETSLPSWGNWWDLPGSSFGDDPRDQKWIDEGKKDFNGKYYDYFDDINGNQCF